MTYTNIAIVGAGAMGAGMAQVFAAASLNVVLLDIKPEFVESGIKKIVGRLESDMKKDKLAPEEKDHVLGRIKGTTNPKDTSGADLVIEAIVEDRKAKGDLFQTLNHICPPETVFATNTSTLSVTDLAHLSGRPERFLGLHFFNPVHAMRLVEVIPGLDTGTEVVEDAYAAIRSIKKFPIVVQDCPGFLVNRILLPYVCEAVMCVQEGVSPEAIDGEAKKAGFPMGPLELSDFVGWDVTLHTFAVLHAAYGEWFPLPELIQKLNDKGRLGVKAGKGVYRSGQVDDDFRAMVKQGNTGFSIERLILRQINAAICCLQEGVASAEDIDRAMVLGTGFPNRDGIGGPLHFADEKGLDWVLSRLEDLSAEESAVRFWPHHLLKAYIRSGRLGLKTGRGFFDY